MNLILDKDAKTEAYTDTKGIISIVVQRFLRVYHPNDDNLKIADHYHEYIAQGNLLFLRAYESFDRTKGASFSTWLYYRVWRGLQDLRKQQITKADRVRADFDGFCDPSDPYRFIDMMDAFSKDAKTVVKLVFETPNDISLTLLEDSSTHAINDAKRAIKEYLRDLGWGIQRIHRTFKEIRHAIGN